VTERRAIRVFISYSNHDGQEHMERVRQLSDALRRDGVDCHIDQYSLPPKEGWPSWTETQINNADFVILVFSETYQEHASTASKMGPGLGVAWEFDIIRNLLYQHPLDSGKFLPVIFSEKDQEYIASKLSGSHRYIVHDVTLRDEGYQQLYRRLTNQPNVPLPELGNPKSLPPKASLVNVWDSFHGISKLDSDEEGDLSENGQNGTEDHCEEERFAEADLLREPETVETPSLPQPQLQQGRRTTRGIARNRLVAAPKLGMGGESVRARYLAILLGMACLFLIGSGITLVFDLPRVFKLGKFGVTKKAEEAKHKAELEKRAPEPRLAPKVLEHLRNGITAFNQNELEDSRRQFESLAREAPELPDGYYWLGRVAARYEQWKNGIQYLDEALKRNNAFAAAYLLRFKMLVMDEHSSDAELLEELANMQGKNPELDRWIKCFLNNDGVKKVHASLEHIGHDCPPVEYELPAGAGLP